MKRRLAYYEPSPYPAKLFVGFVVVFLIYRILVFDVDTTSAVKLLIITTIVAAGFIINKMINRFSYFNRYYSFEFDEDRFYFKSHKAEYNISLSNVKAIKLNGPLYEGDFRFYRIEYWDHGILCRTDIRVLDKSYGVLLDFKALVLQSNPSVEIENSWPNDFSLMDKFTEKLNRFSEKLFPPRDIP